MLEMGGEVKTVKEYSIVSDKFGEIPFILTKRKEKKKNISST